MTHRGIVFDLDGTLYFGEKAADEARASLRQLDAAGFDLYFLSNNSGKSRRELFRRLQTLDFPAEESRVYNAAYAVARTLSKSGIQRVLLLGSEGLRTELNARGILCVDEGACEAVVLGWTRDFTYAHIAKAFDAVTRHGARIVAANVDRNFPIGEGRMLPGANTVVAALLGSLDPDIPCEVVGKPEPHMLRMIAEDHGLKAEELLMVGDREESDGEAARRFGCSALIVGDRGLTLRETQIIMESYR